MVLALSTGDQIAIWSIVVVLLVAAVQVVINHLYRIHDEKPKVTAKINPHIFIGPDGKPLLHGMAVAITSHRKEIAEIVNVRLRLQGVDVANAMMEGFSSAKPIEKSPYAKKEDSGLEVHLRFEHNGQLIINSNKAAGLRVTKNKTVTFFTPLPIFPLMIQKLFDDANEKDISIVAHILPNPNTILLKGSEVSRLMRECLNAYANKPVDPNYGWTIGVFTVATNLPDTAPIGQINDKPIIFDRDLGEST